MWTRIGVIGIETGTEIEIEIETGIEEIETDEGVVPGIVIAIVDLIVEIVIVDVIIDLGPGPGTAILRAEKQVGGAGLVRGNVDLIAAENRGILTTAGSTMEMEEEEERSTQITRLGPVVAAVKRRRAMACLNENFVVHVGVAKKKILDRSEIVNE